MVTLDLSSDLEAFLGHLDAQRRAGVAGGAGSGKSSVLREAAQVLPEALLISPPVGDGDAAESALVELASKLDDAQVRDALMDPELDTSEKVDTVVDVLQQRDDLILLLDDPPAWAPDEDEATATDLFLRLSDGILESNNKVGIAARAGSTRLSEEFTIRLKSQTLEAATWASEEWGSLSESAELVANAVGSRKLTLPLFTYRVICAHVSFNGASWPTRPVVRKLFSRVMKDDADLAIAWGVGATIRHPSDRQTAIEDLDTGQRELYESGLLRLCEPGEFRLPSVFRSVGETEDGEITRPLHDRLAEEWQAADSLLAEYERFHHAARGTAVSDADLWQPLLREQWHALGRWYSQRESYEKASRVFQRALDLDDSDAYAHHYLAYNLDAWATRPDDVEQHYREAIKHNPSVTWWHSRFIRFLITRERIEDAREAWDQALLDVGSGASESQQLKVFRDLHAEVCRQLIDALELEFAAAVLAGVDSDLVADEPRFESLRGELSRVHAALNGSSFLPVSSDQIDREAPLLLPTFRESWGHLGKWWQAAVEEVRQDGSVALVAREYDDGWGEDALTVETSVDDLRADGLSTAPDPGMLLEFGFYEHGETLVLHHPPRRHMSWAARTPYLDPMRYVLRGKT